MDLCSFLERTALNEEFDHKPGLYVIQTSFAEDEPRYKLGASRNVYRRLRQYGTYYAPMLAHVYLHAIFLKDSRSLFKIETAVHRTLRDQFTEPPEVRVQVVPGSPRADPTVAFKGCAALRKTTRRSEWYSWTHSQLEDVIRQLTDSHHVDGLSDGVYLFSPEGYKIIPNPARTTRATRAAQGVAPAPPVCTRVMRRRPKQSQFSSRSCSRSPSRSRSRSPSRSWSSYSSPSPVVLLAEGRVRWSVGTQGGSPA